MADRERSRACHVVPAGDGTWRVEAEGQPDGGQRFARRSEAIAAARRAARFASGSLVVHRRDGSVASIHFPRPAGGTGAEFEADLDHLLDKNAELYRRLAR